MKQKLVLSFLAVAFTVLSATAQNSETVVVNAGNLEHITISSDLDVVILPATDNLQAISMDAAASEKLGIRFSNNSMTISPTTKPKKDFTVYLYVNKLKSLVIENDASVRNLGVLDAPNLALFVGTETRAHLKTNGDIKAYPINDARIRVSYLRENGLAKQNRNKEM